MSNDRAQELTAKINQSITALCAETDAAKQSETYLAWLSTVSRFYKYSFGNCLLIWMQAPEATRVAGFHTWKLLGRFVKKGETGIRILAPIVRKVDEEKNGTTEKVSQPFGFRTVSVFAQEQTDGQPLPELNTNAAEGGETLLPLLEKAATQLNITLVCKPIAGSAEGYSKGGLIEIEETLDNLFLSATTANARPARTPSGSRTGCARPSRCGTLRSIGKTAPKAHSDTRSTKSFPVCGTAAWRRAKWKQSRALRNLRPCAFARSKAGICGAEVSKVSVIAPMGRGRISAKAVWRNSRGNWTLST